MAFERSLSVLDDLQEEINQETRATALNLLRGLIRLTPVDTGRAKGNWFVGVNIPKREVNPERRQAQALADGSTNIATARAIAYPEIIVSNNLPYIERLNNGHSMQAPKMFVETEITRVANARGVTSG